MVQDIQLKNVTAYRTQAANDPSVYVIIMYFNRNIHTVKFYSLTRCGFVIVTMFFVLSFALLFLGSLGLTFYDIVTYCKVEGVVSNSDIVMYRNKRGARIYSMSCTADYVVEGRKYSTSKICPRGNISSNFEMLIKWNYQNLLDKTMVSVYCNSKDPSDSFIFYVCKVVWIAILISCLLIVFSLVLICKFLVKFFVLLQNNVKMGGVQ